MPDFETELRRTLNEMGAAQATGAHPDNEAWIAYRAGELTAAEEVRQQEHLAWCRPCAALVAELAAFDRPNLAPGLPDVERAATWRVVRAGIARQPVGERRLRRPAAMAAIAAGLAAAVLALGVWSVQQRTETGLLRRQIVELTRPQPNQPVIDVAASYQVTRGDGEAATAGVETVEVPGQGWVTLSIDPDHPAGRFERYRASLVDPRGVTAWSGELAPDGLGFLSLGVNGRSLPAAGSTLVIDGLDAGDGPVELLRLHLLRAD